MAGAAPGGRDPTGPGGDNGPAVRGQVSLARGGHRPPLSLNRTEPNPVDLWGLMAGKRSRPKTLANPKGYPERDRPGTDLLVRFREGDGDAFREIVGAYQERLVQFFYRLCWDLDRAEDFTQELFMKLLRGARRYRPQGRLTTFIYRVATNLWIDHYRSMRPQPRLYSLDQAVHTSDSDTAVEEPEDVAIRKERKQSLRRALESLTQPHRLVFELAVYQELPYAQVGQVLGIPVGTVKSRMHNSVRAIRELLRETEEDAGDSAPRSAGYPAPRSAGCPAPRSAGNGGHTG